MLSDLLFVILTSIMNNYSKYFSENRYHSVYSLGDRVRGLWNDIPFSGSVAIDTMLDEYEGPYVLVFSDLPVRHNGLVHQLLKVTHRQINSL